MDPISKIESQKDVLRVRSSGLQLWTLVRMPLYDKLNYPSAPPRRRWRKAVALAVRFFQLFQIRHIWRRTDILFSSIAPEMKPIDGGIRNRLFYFFHIIRPNLKKTHMVLADDNFIRGRRYMDPHRFSAVPVHVAARLLASIFPAPVIENEHILYSVYKSVGVNLDHSLILRRFLAYRSIYRRILRWQRPRMIVLSCYYSNSMMALIAAAHELGIPVVEVQHGVINSEHVAYNDYSGELGKSLFPDDLLSFGNEREALRGHSFIPIERIWPMGHPYISYLSERSGRTENPSPFIMVTLQSMNEEEVVRFVRESAILNPNMQFRLVPRVLENLGRFKDLPDNVIVETQMDFYGLVPSAWIHLTASSTCAIEVPVFGVPNILFDHDGLARQYYGSILTPDNGTFYVNRPEEMTEAIAACLRMDRLRIREFSKKLIGQDFKNNLDAFLKLRGF